MSRLNDIEKLRGWCHKVLPLVYDDSLSYYEVLCKVRAKINEVIDLTAEQNDVIEEAVQEITDWETTTDEKYNEFVAQMDSNFDTFKSQINSEVDTFEGNVTQAITTFESTVNGTVTAYKNEIDASELQYKNQMQALYDEFLNDYLQTLGVVQTYGVSQTDVMSQKVVSEGLLKSAHTTKIVTSTGTTATATTKTAQFYAMAEPHEVYGDIQRITINTSATVNDDVDLIVFVKVTGNTYKVVSVTNIGSITSGLNIIDVNIKTPNEPYYIGFSNNFPYAGTGTSMQYGFVTGTPSAGFTFQSNLASTAKFSFEVYVNTSEYIKEIANTAIQAETTAENALSEVVPLKNASPITTVLENLNALSFSSSQPNSMYIFGTYNRKCAYSLKFKLYQAMTFYIFIIDATTRKIVYRIDIQGSAGWNEKYFVYQDMPKSYYIGISGDPNGIIYNATGTMPYRFASGLETVRNVGDVVSFGSVANAEFNISLKQIPSPYSLEYLTEEPTEPLENKIIFLAGDSRSSTDYTFYGTTLTAKTKAQVLIKGASGRNAAYNASNTYFATIVPHDFSIWIVGGNDTGASNSVGTFSATSPNGIAGEPVVQETDISEDYDGTYFIQAIDHIIRKYKSLYYDFKTINDGHKYRMIMCTDLPQNRNDASSAWSQRANWERKVNAIIEACQKNNIPYLDLYHECAFDMSKEPYWTSPTDFVTDNGIYFMDGLHPNRYGIDIITSLEVQEMKKFISINPYPAV